MTEAIQSSASEFDEPYETRRRLALYECAVMAIETKFKILSAQFSSSRSYNPIDTIKCRVKDPESIAEKLVRRNLPATFDSMDENLTDIAGVRVICPFVEDIYALADMLLEQEDVTLLERKDYIEKPKNNGYRSLHLIVETPIFTPDGKQTAKVEIQMRTIAMDFWANLEHRLKYKRDLDPELVNDLSFELYSCAEESAELDRRMGAVRRKIDATRTLLDME